MEAVAPPMLEIYKQITQKLKKRYATIADYEANDAV